MDDLDLLKKDWKKQEKNLPHLSYDEIYKMIWKRSSSIVKWIFIISIVEFLLGAFLNIFLADDHYWEQMEKYNLTESLLGTHASRSLKDSQFQSQTSTYLTQRRDK